MILGEKDEENFYVPSKKEVKARISRKKKKEAIKEARKKVGYSKKTKDRSGR